MTKKGPARCPGTKTIAVPRSKALIDTIKSTIDYIEMYVSVHIKGIETSIFKMTKVQNHISHSASIPASNWLSLDVTLIYLRYYIHCPIKLTLIDKQPSNKVLLARKILAGYNY